MSDWGECLINPISELNQNQNLYKHHLNKTFYLLIKILSLLILPVKFLFIKYPLKLITYTLKPVNNIKE